MIALCASHIACVARLRHFQDMVRSWAAQSSPLPLHVSMSCTPELRAVVERAVDKLIHAHRPLLMVNVTDAPLSQFEHYRELALHHLAGVPDATPVIFTDDDDLWHPERAAVLSADAGALIDHPNVFACLSANYTAQEQVADAAAAHKAPRCADDVDRLMRKGKITATGTSNIQHLGEYVNLCVLLGQLRRFLRACSTSLLQHPMCDMFMLKFFRVGNSAKSAIVNLSPNIRWLYFYRKMGACATVTDNLTSRGDPALNTDARAAALCGRHADLLPFFTQRMALLASRRHAHDSHDWVQILHIGQRWPLSDAKLVRLGNHMKDTDYMRGLYASPTWDSVPATA